ncbi:MAG: ribonuclease J [Ruminococcaceae bacterium]|nr:ribonuclease J [Oscillospiraceae bacterium]
MNRPESEFKSSYKDYSKDYSKTSGGFYKDNFQRRKTTGRSYDDFGLDANDEISAVNTSNLTAVAEAPKTEKEPNTNQNQNNYANKAYNKKPYYNNNRYGKKPYYNNNNYQKKQEEQKEEIKKPPVKIYFLGGLNEIGKNFTVYECEGDMIIVDCGLSFPTDDMLGIDLVIPDFTFIEENLDKIKGMVITHGHEDHIGSIPYFLKRFSVPIYATPLTAGLIEAKLKEHNLVEAANIQRYKAGSKVKLGVFDIEFIHVNHSVSDAVAFALHTPAGTIVHTGDFKIDCTPTEGEMIDLGRFAQLGKEGVLCLLADSTNAERAGYTQTEQKVNDTLNSMFSKAGKKRIIIATFASSVSRIQMIINCAEKYGRKVALSGRSMLNVVAIASELGYLKVPEGIMVDLSTINNYTKEEIVLITTGSQGEPMSALSRMAFSEHRQVEVGEDDFIIISARPIPGNEKTVSTVINELLKKGCEVIYESMYDLHVSGHACQEELKIMQALTKPKFFIPIHGEQKHLVKHASLSMSLGTPKENIFIGDIGSAVELSDEGIKILEKVQAGQVLVDGIGVGDVGSIVLRDRKLLSEDGLIIAVCALDSMTGRVVSGPDVVSRGFVYVRESEEMMETARNLIHDVIENCADQGIREWGAIKLRIRDTLSKYLFEQTRRTPMILPIIMEV